MLEGPIGVGICQVGKGTCDIIFLMEDNDLIALIGLPDDQVV